MQRILLVGSSYLPNVGGVQQVASQLASGLQARGHMVAVLTSRYPRTLLGKEVMHGVPVTRWHFLLPRWRDLARGRPDLFLAGIFFFPLTLLRLLLLLWRTRPDVVNLHFLGAPALFVTLARAVFKFRFVVSLHGDDVEGFTRQSRFDQWIFRVTLARADYVTACSRYLLAQAQRIVPEIESKSNVIYNGVADLPVQGASPAAPQLIAVARLVPKKGFDIFLRALAQLPECRARLIGDGPERNALEQLARELKIQNRVQFYGARSHEEVIHLMTEAQIIVIPSRQEPFGLVALQALALGKPIVAARVGGLPEILEGADARLVEPNDPSALAHAVQDSQARLAQNPGFGERNRALAARFSLATMIDDYVRVLLPREEGQ